METGNSRLKAYGYFERLILAKRVRTPTRNDAVMVSRQRYVSHEGCRADICDHKRCITRGTDQL